MAKALGLLSGGLDSSLAALTLKKQGLEVTCVAFVTPFFGADKARDAAARMDIPLLVRDISEVHLEMVKNPHYGYGKNMNPCIDCHAMMFRFAGEIMEEIGADFLFSGEVLGQRPMSQNSNALKAVAKHSGLKGQILRPLSARLLPETSMEDTGLVDRDALLDIQGRSRKRQEALARQWGLDDYPASGGGCLLTEKSFSGRLRDLLEKNPDATAADVELLKHGRQFRLANGTRLILGRNEADNGRLEALAGVDDLKLRSAAFRGPLGLVRGRIDDRDLREAAALVASYGKGREEQRLEVLVKGAGTQIVMKVTPMGRQEARELAVL
ncbi:MAG: thiamine biosynthesis protein [Desulfuromonadales bacterium]